MVYNLIFIKPVIYIAYSYFQKLHQLHFITKLYKLLHLCYFFKILFVLVRLF